MNPASGTITVSFFASQMTTNSTSFSSDPTHHANGIQVLYIVHPTVFLQDMKKEIPNQSILGSPRCTDMTTSGACRLLYYYYCRRIRDVKLKVIWPNSDPSRLMFVYPKLLWWTTPTDRRSQSLSIYYHPRWAPNST